MSGYEQALVFSGYDRVADAYVERFGVSQTRHRWFEHLVAALPINGGQVLDLGCGAGVPVARDLAGSGHNVVGVDGSAQQILRARRNVPQAQFIQADMCTVDFEAERFDAVGAFYSITHVPPVQQGDLIANIARWLKPGGAFVASFGAGETSHWTGEWLGTTMFFGHGGEVETLLCLTDAGFQFRHTKVEQQDNEDAAFLWVHAVRG